MAKYKTRGLNKDFVQTMRGITISDDEATIISSAPKKTLLQKLGFKKTKLSININRTEVKSVERKGITFLY